MDWTLALEGFLLGLGAAVPVGPVNIEIIRRCLLIHPVAGAALGAGAVSADLLYLSLIFLGLGALVAASPAFGMALGVGGALFLAWLGVGAIRSGLDREAIAKKLAEARHSTPDLDAEAKNDAQDSGGPKLHLPKQYAFGLLMTFLNPYTIAFWLSVGSRPGIAGEGPLADKLAPLALGVAMGAGGWVMFLTGLLAMGRRFAGVRFLMFVSVLGGLVLLGFAGARAWALFG